MTDVSSLTQTLRERGVHLSVESGRLKVQGKREMLTPALKDALRRHSAALIRQAKDEHRRRIKPLQDAYVPLLLDLWGSDVIGPLACWLWFEVERLPMDVWISPWFYADLAFYQRLKAGMESGPTFKHKALLRWALFDLYAYLEGKANEPGSTMRRRSPTLT